MKPQISRDIGLVGCVKTKLDVPAPARDLYNSPLFRGRVRYIQSRCDRWFILSAEHGLVSPDQILEPYDRTMTDMSRAERRSWSRSVVERLWVEVGPLEGLKIDVHAGAEYRDFGLLSGLKERGTAVWIPAFGMSLGEQLAFYSMDPE